MIKKIEGRGKTYDYGEEEQMPYIYMVRCTDHSLYTGITTDVERRMREHIRRKGSGAKYTRSHRVCSLEMVWEAGSLSAAAKLEYRIKQLPKSRKEALLLHPEQANELEFLPRTEERYVPRPELAVRIDSGFSKGEDSGE